LKYEFSLLIHNLNPEIAQIQGNQDLMIVVEMMAENTEFARNYLGNEQFRTFINSNVIQQALARMLKPFC